MPFGWPNKLSVHTKTCSYKLGQGNFGNPGTGSVVPGELRGRWGIAEKKILTLPERPAGCTFWLLLLPLEIGASFKKQEQQMHGVFWVLRESQAPIWFGVLVPAFPKVFLLSWPAALLVRPSCCSCSYALAWFLCSQGKPQAAVTVEDCNVLCSLTAVLAQTKRYLEHFNIVLFEMSLQQCKLGVF